MLAKGASRQTPDAESELVKREQEAVEACRKLQRKARKKFEFFRPLCKLNSKNKWPGTLSFSWLLHTLLFSKLLLHVYLNSHHDSALCIQ